MTYQLFAFKAYNTETLYGWGDEIEADAYCDHLNSDREINVYGWQEITDPEVIAQKERDGIGVNLDDELTELRDSE